VAFNYIKDIENLLYSYINNSKLAICENAYTIFMKISNNSSISIKYPRYIEYLELDMQFLDKTLNSLRSLRNSPIADIVNLSAAFSAIRNLKKGYLNGRKIIINIKN
jgi:hypothetical protein